MSDVWSAARVMVESLVQEGGSRSIVQLTDWLPPEFSAVSQYAVLIAEEAARTGHRVTVVGLNTYPRPIEVRRYGAGSITLVSVQRRPVNRQSWRRRLMWNAGTNLALVKAAWPYMQKADTIRFTGSPPFLLHFLVPANALLKKELLYRITDFYPEVIMAAMARKSRALDALSRLTNVLRRRVDLFEVLGHDMRARLLAAGVEERRVHLKRDLSPVVIGSETRPSPRPAGADGRKLLLYSGNWGVAHDTATFIEAYKQHHQAGSARVVLWLNATGSGAEEVERRLRAERLPFFRQNLVPLEDLPSLLVGADAHLITLKPEFVGFVLPSKIYGCLASKRPVVFIGPKASDVHELCLTQGEQGYMQANVGDVEGVARSRYASCCRSKAKSLHRRNRWPRPDA